MALNWQYRLALSSIVVTYFCIWYIIAYFLVLKSLNPIKTNFVIFESLLVTLLGNLVEVVQIPRCQTQWGAPLGKVHRCRRSYAAAGTYRLITGSFRCLCSSDLLVCHMHSKQTPLAPINPLRLLVRQQNRNEKEWHYVKSAMPT